MEARAEVSASSAATLKGSQFRLLGLPWSAWSFAFRTWIAMMAALYVAFWLQLESPSAAAVCVGILARPTRGQAYERAFYRLVGTAVGLVASVIITSLFDGERDLFLLAFAGWMAVCVYLASLLDGNRAYGAVLSAYTVAIVAVANIDAPQDVFLIGIDRGAANVIGIAALMLSNDALAAPDVFPGLVARLVATHGRVVAFAQSVLDAGKADPQELSRLLKTITEFRTDIATLSSESVAGRTRAATARAMVAALARELAAAHSTGTLLNSLDLKARDFARILSKSLDQAHASPNNELNARIDDTIDTHYCASSSLAAASLARVLIDQNRRTLAALSDLRDDRGGPHGPHLPLFRASEAAVRNAARVFLAMLMSAGLFVAVGLPSTSFLMLVLGVMVAFSAITPNPATLAQAALIAMPTAFALAGIVKFVILDGTDAFPLLALGMAPVIVGAALLVAGANSKLSPVGTLLLIYTPILLSPTNPQSYDPQNYLDRGSEAVLAVIVLFVLVCTVLPTDDTRKRAWILRSLRVDFHRALRQPQSTLDPDDLAFRDADRLGQLGALRSKRHDDQAADLQRGFHWAALTSAAGQLRLALADRHLPSSLELEGRAALKSEDPEALRRVADRLLSPRGKINRDNQQPRRWAAATLVWMAMLIERNPSEVKALDKELADDP